MDGGTTWDTTTIDGGADDDDLGTGRRFDPTMIFDADGNFFVAYGFQATPSSSYTLVVARSEDGGESFEHFEQVETAIVLDKWFLTSGPNPTGDPVIYVAYSAVRQGVLRIVVAGSDDGAESFVITTVSEAIPSTLPLFACPAVGPNGELYVSWYNPMAGDCILFNRDLDGLWDTVKGFAAQDFEIRELTNGALQGYPVSAAPERGITTSPILTVDRSGGSYNGRLYLTFLELAASDPSEDSNVKLGYGTLNTQTDNVDWTFLAQPVDSSTGTEFNPWVDVDDATGSVNLFYYTTDGDQTSDNDDVKMRMAVSLNGGAGWTTANATGIDSNESGGWSGDYLEYNGFDVHQGTAHGLFAFEPFEQGASSLDLEALYVNAAFVNANNTLTVDGTTGGDTIIVEKHALNDDYLRVQVNGNVEFAGRLASVGLIQVDGGDGNDTISIDGRLGLGVTVNGGAGTDNVIFLGTSAGDNITSTSSTIVLGSTVLTPTNTEARSMYGDAGNDSINLGSLSQAVSIFGDGGDDTLTGGSGADSIVGNDGVDSLIGGAGNDTMYGGTGGDAMRGGDGNDSIFGEAGNDGMYGENNNDTLNGGSGTDYMSGGSGTDDFGSQDGEIDTLDGGSGWDTGFIDYGEVIDEEFGIETIFY
jgi:Ca2+-binding RTX toxin-like protein